MKNIIFTIFLSPIYLFCSSYTFNAKIIDDLSKSSIDRALVIINEKDSLYSNENGEISFQTNIKKLHIDIFKLQYKNFHFDIDISNIDYQVLIPIHSLEFHIHEIIVNADKNNNLFNYNEDTKSINSNMSVSVGETLNSIKGVELRSMGAAPTRPVFRGLGNDRLKINIDGLENKDLSASSPDHNIAIDPLSINEAQIIRGPETLKFSSSSSAGVINLVNDEIPIKIIDNQKLELKNYFNSNNSGIMSFIEYQTNAFDLFNAKVKYSKILSNNIQTPKKVLHNSEINTDNFEFGVGKILNNAKIGLNYNYYKNDYGIPPGPNGMHPKGVNIKMYKKDIKFIYIYIYQNNKYLKELNVNYLFNYLQHNEFESSGILGAKYIINNNLIKFDLKGNNILNANKNDFGFFISNNYFDAGAAVRTPEVTDYSTGFYVIQSYIYDKINLDFAYRVEGKKYLPKKDISVNQNTKLFERNFLISSFSSSLLYNFNANSNAGLIISYDERIPTLEELYSMGPHLASYSYDIGNQKINKENSINFELIFQNKYLENNFILENNINIFNYYFLNYITPRNTGKIDLLRTRLPIYENKHIKANLSGFENEIIVKINNLIMTNITQFTIGFNLSENLPLPMIPPLKNIFSISYKHNLFDISIINETALSQNRIDEFETPTSAYSIFNLKSSYYFYFLGMQNQLVFNIKNILNSTYRNHLSRIKTIMPESGINFSIGLNNYF